MTSSLLDNERQPLLHDSEFSSDINRAAARSGLPWSQIVILGIWRATHAIYFGYILTWITRFLLYIEVADHANVGRVAGWVESAYSLGVLTGLAPASYLSDTIGRKKTAISGVLGASIATILFGFCKTVPQLVTLRYINGLFVAFLPATVVTTLVELSTPDTMPLIFAISSASWTFGSFIAPGIGGCLAEPATQFSGLFAGTIWEAYPYALSGLMAVSIPLAATLASIPILQETLPRAKRRSLLALFRPLPGKNEQDPRTLISYKDLLTKPVIFIVSVQTWYWIMIVGFSVAQVLYLSTPLDAGGLNLNPREMALLYSVRPLMSNAVNLGIYPTLARRYPTEQIFRWGSLLGNTTIYAAHFALGMVTSTYKLHNSTIIAILFVFAIPMACNSITSAACVQTLSSRAPTKAHLAKMNTLGEYASNLGHGLGAIAASNIWTIAVTHNILHGQLVWLYLLGMTFLLAIFNLFLTKVPGWQDKELAEEEAIERL